MFINQNFIFRTNISIDNYQSKTDAIACLSKNGAKAIGKEKMAFFEHDVSIDQFLQFATNGFAFCNLFDYDPNQEYWFQSNNGQWNKCSPVYKTGNHKGGMKLCMKADQFFKGAQTVFVDVDYTRYSNIVDYLDTLTYRPTCVYMSFSDNKDKGGITSRRFRMVYVFDRILNKKELIHISQTINDQIVFDTAEPMEDDCGTRISQYMNGVYGNNECYTNYYIYQVQDFPEEQPEQICMATATSEAQQGIVFDERMLTDMGDMDYNTFMHYYSWQYQYKYRTEGPEWIDNWYQLTDEDYLQLWWYREKQVDGQHRRRKLFKNACLRRLMFPDMDPSTALFNLYIDFVRFFDNSDNVITLETLVRKVKHAFDKTSEQLMAYCAQEISYWHNHRPQFIVKSGNKVTWGTIRKIQKNISWSKIDMYYDRSISVQANIEKGINVSSSTLYRYCQERRINTNPQRSMSEAERRNSRKQEKEALIQKFIDLYDPNCSIRENQTNLTANGIELSVGSINNWAKMYVQKPAPKSIVPTLNFSIDIPDFNIRIKRNTEIEQTEPFPSPQEDMDLRFACPWPIPEFYFA